MRGIAVDYKVVKLGKKEWIVHQRLLDKFPVAVPTRSLYVVGVAEQALFWKDIRLVLFSKLHFRVLCRLTQSGIQNSWTPVKLADVLRMVMPDIAEKIAMFGTFLTVANKSEQKLERKQELAYDALIGYAKLLAKHYGHSVTDQDLFDANLPSEQHYQVFGSVRERRASFEAMSEFVSKRFNIERDPDVVVKCREKALQDAGLDIFGQPVKQEALVSPSSNVDESFLDSEIIAIYW